ncbi:ASTRA-associated protein 1 [Candida viswanathii]|uniref:ASTRA-associated protein 1 n=1 Tax=Candida viswanathii TaxID=5486 RepID=A0A367YG74_9ASCO|nr:ASTRA-associated protein 1 [Candida viswanathii]
MSQQFTLRSHKSSITYIYPSPTIPTELYTADSTGFLIKWDLTTRRPVSSWQAHTDTVLTISSLQGRLLTHSRDNTIKVWDNTTCVMEVPCNALNFSNVVVLHDEVLITPASINSNNVDVYRVTLAWGITRLMADVNVHLLVETGVVFTDEVGSRNDYGIIMKMHVLDDVVYVGFESGDVVGLQLVLPQATVKNSSANNDTLVINQSAKLVVKYHDATHVPNPVISLLSFKGSLVSGSTTNKVVVHTYPPEVLKVEHSGVQAILNDADKDLIIGFWNGEIRCGETRIHRDVPMVQNSSADDRSKSVKKLTFMALLEPKEDEEGVGDGKNKYSLLIRAKKLLTATILLVGYEDGSIVAYKV